MSYRFSKLSKNESGRHSFVCSGIQDDFLETVVAVLFADRPFLVVNITIVREGGR